MPPKQLNVALIGSKFMGRAHSNAYLNVAKFFDLPVKPVMHTVAARDTSLLPDFADAYETQKVLHAVILSARERRPVKLSQVK